MNAGSVISVSRSQTHSLLKWNERSIELIKGRGVKGDAHMGETVKHRSRVAKDPNQPNLRQVHLIHSELFDELHQKGFDIAPGVMGENITTIGIDLLSLPTNAILRIGKTVKVQITGLRNPCYQLDGIQEGLMKAVLDKSESGELIRKAGVMGIVIEGGDIFIGNDIIVELPAEPHSKLERV